MSAFGVVHSGGHEGPRLTTKHYDEDSGLYYFGARWYDPAVGRWIEAEPLGLDGPNLFTFNYMNPINRYDRTGKSSFPAPPILSPVEGAMAVYAGLCGKNISDQTDLFYNGGGGGDKFKHCLVGCRMRRECCGYIPCPPRVIETLSIYHEILGVGPSGTWGDDETEDHNATMDGAKACKEKGCEEACGAKYPSIPNR